jgi:hypothetical protein
LPAPSTTVTVPVVPLGRVTRNPSALEPFENDQCAASSVL